MKRVIEKKIFLIKTTLSVYPIFYVEAIDILDATNKAMIVVDYFKNKKLVINVTALDTPILDLEEDQDEK